MKYNRPAEEKKIVVHTKTKKEYDRLMEAYDRKGWTWAYGTKATEYDAWSSNRGETCIYFHDKCYYASFHCHEQRSDEYTIISTEEALKRLGEPKLTTKEQVNELFNGCWKTNPSIQTKPKKANKFMSIIKTLTRTEAEKAKDYYDIVDSCGNLTSTGHEEVTSYIYENGAFDRKDFDAKLVKAWKEATK